MEINRFALENKIAKLTADLSKKIAQDNRAFARMSKKKQRVAIAKDVLASLKSGLFNAKRGVYLRKTAKSTGTACEVCAIGSMFAACSLRRGTVDEIDTVERHQMVETLSAYFSDEELDIIEDAFERNNNYDTEESELAGKYTRGLSAEAALKKIMKNIVDNGGDFVLED